MENVKYDVHDIPKTGMLFGLSFQHLFAMFGSTVLVPILVGIDPAIALFSSGLGTLAHLTVTKYKIPAYMGSSFAYIATMQMLMKTDGIAAVAQGAIAGGLVYLIVALIVKFAGNAWIDKVLPPIVVGPIIIVIGLSLATTAVNDVMLKDGEYNFTYLLIGMVTLLAVILFNMYGKKIIGVIPILLGLIVGYLFSLIVGAVTGQTIVDLPGLDRTLTGDGIAQIIAGVFGAPPVTSYGENIGVMALNKIYSVYVIAGAAVIAVVMSFIGKISALLSSIPTPVIGGISIALFGVIASSGLKILVENKIDFDNKKNLLIASVILVSGIGGLTLQVAGLQITGVAFSTLLGIILYQILPEKD